MKIMKRIGAIALILCVVLTAFTACASQPKKLIGAWRDSTGTTGYEFKEDGVVDITYANFTIPIINVKYDGTVTGTYTTTKNDDKSYSVTINYTILTQTLSSTYTFVVDKSQLTLTDTSNGNQTVLMAYTAPAADTSASAQ